MMLVVGHFRVPVIQEADDNSAELRLLLLGGRGVRRVGGVRLRRRGRRAGADGVRPRRRGRGRGRVVVVGLLYRLLHRLLRRLYLWLGLCFLGLCSGLCGSLLLLGLLCRFCGGLLLLCFSGLRLGGLLLGGLLLGGLCFSGLLLGGWCRGRVGVVVICGVPLGGLLRGLLGGLLLPRHRQALSRRADLGSLIGCLH